MSKIYSGEQCEKYYKKYTIVSAVHKIIDLEQALLDIQKQLTYLETYSSRNDVYEDMSRRLNRIENIVNKALGDKENE